MQRILIVEDDRAIIAALEQYLRTEDFDPVSATGEREAVRLMDAFSPELVLIDISLAEGDGFSVCRCAKERGIPAVFLTASGDENSVVEGLDLGADDYISKPYRPRELVSRIRSVLRRNGKGQRVVKLGGVSVDTDKGTVKKDGEVLPLTALEFKLLMVFVNNRGKLLSRTRLLDEIWDVGGDFVNDNTLTVYIKRLREKIGDDPAGQSVIKTVRGLGYRVD